MIFVLSYLICVIISMCVVFATIMINRDEWGCELDNICASTIAILVLSIGWPILLSVFLCQYFYKLISKKGKKNVI